MKLLLKKVDGLEVPSQANPPSEKEVGDAGYDIVATTEPQIKGEFIERPIDRLKVWKKVIYIEYGTNLYWAPQQTVDTRVTGIEVFDKPYDKKGKVKAYDITASFKDYHIELFPRSSISKYSLVLANSVGTIDNGYRAQVLLRFKYIFQPEDFVVLPEAGVQRVYGLVNPELIYQKGDKICQLKARENIPVTFEVVEELPPSGRNLGGFGSSGK
jgi:dUTPase